MLSTTNPMNPVMGRGVPAAQSVVDVHRFQDFLAGSPTFPLLLRRIDAWAFPRTSASSAGRGNRSSIPPHFFRVGGIGTWRTSRSGCTNERTEEVGPMGGGFSGFEGRKDGFLEFDSSCGEGKGYSNREEGSNGVPIIAEGECNLRFANEKVFEPSDTVTSSTI